MSFNSKIRNDVIKISIMCYLAQHKQYFHENSHTMRAYVIWRRHHRAWIGWCRVIPMLPNGKTITLEINKLPFEYRFYEKLVVLCPRFRVFPGRIFTSKSLWKSFQMSSKMQRFRRAISFRRSQRHVPESCRPHQWESDGHKVKSGGLSFPVKVRIFVCICIYMLLKES